SGTNSFALAPGRVIVYARNVHTVEELDRHGFAVVEARDVAEGRVDPASYRRCAIVLPGSELPRGGGGPRCMTMPLRRAPLRAGPGRAGVRRRALQRLRRSTTVISIGAGNGEAMDRTLEVGREVEARSDRGVVAVRGVGGGGR
ncbi:MAG: arginine deiminase family protein, partial [bacterium]|nr:arginine deiminase family protein [bacterium]